MVYRSVHDGGPVLDSGTPEGRDGLEEDHTVPAEGRGWPPEHGGGGPGLGGDARGLRSLDHLCAELQVGPC